MWLFTKHGFLSVVQKQEGHGITYHVRARSRDQLSAVLTAVEFPLSIITETEDADYRYRVVVSRTEWMTIAEKLAAGVDYPNFKDEAKKHVDEDFRYLLGSVWRLLWNYQQMIAVPADTERKRHEQQKKPQPKLPKKLPPKSKNGNG